MIDCGEPVGRPISYPVVVNIAINESTNVPIDISGLAPGAYNLRGERVNGNYRGIVIRNGKKYVVK